MAIIDGQVLSAADIYPVAGKMTLSTAGPTISTASTWTQVTAFDTLTYDTSNLGAGGMMAIATGIITIPAAGKYRSRLVMPWSSYGSANDRMLAIQKGTAAPSSTPEAAKRITITGRWWDSVEAEGIYAAGDKLTAWIWSSVTSTGGEPATTLAPLTSFSIQKIGI